MSDLHRALADISSIRRQVARSAEFRGYGPATIAVTGLIALAAAMVQAWWLPNPAQDVRPCVTLWLVTAFVSAGLICAQMMTRSRRMHSSMSGEMMRMAVAQFVPSAGAGLLLTYVVLYHAASAAWMLPGLWQVVFSLGVFASCRFLPRTMSAAAVWYLATGLACIAIGQRTFLSPWMMGVPYSVGQFLVAAILWTSAKEAGDEA